MAIVMSEGACLCAYIGETLHGRGEVVAEQDLDFDRCDRRHGATKTVS